MRNLRLLACAATVLGAFAADAQAPAAFSVQRVGAPPIALSSLRGKVVALVFISTTCPHCQEFTTKLAPIANEYTPRGVQFLECAVNPGAQFWVAGFVQQFQPPFPVGYSDQAPVDLYLKRDPKLTFYVPHVVFLDKAGNVAGDYAGESDFMKDPAANTRKELDKMLAPRTSAKKTAPGKPSMKQ